MGLGLAHEGLALYQDAERHLRRAVESLEEVRDSLPEGKKLYFLAGKTGHFSRIAAYETLVRVLKNQGKEEEAFHYAEYTRSRLLTEAIAGRSQVAKTESTTASGNASDTGQSPAPRETVLLSKLISLANRAEMGKEFTDAQIEFSSFFILLAKSIYENYG